MIFLRNVPSDPNRIQPVQPCFLAASAAAVSQNPAVADQEDIRDKLLVTLVVFGVTPVQIHQPGRGANHREIFLDLEAKALKHPQLLEQLSFKTQDSFFCCHTSIYLFVCCCKYSTVARPVRAKPVADLLTGYSHSGWKSRPRRHNPLTGVSRTEILPPVGSARTDRQPLAAGADVRRL